MDDFDEAHSLAAAWANNDAATMVHAIRAYGKSRYEAGRRSIEAASPAAGWEDIRAIVNAQAEDEGLWFVARYASEAYLQQELRRLHSAVEQRPSPSEEARAG